MSNKIIIDKYKNKILGVKNYKSSNQQISCDDLLTFEAVEGFLEEVYYSESRITKLGLGFLSEYFGFDNLSKNLLPIFSEKFKDLDSEKKIKAWMKEL
jgi:hypothetical protein